MIDETFLDNLASSAPTPGGGGACAYCGALACALASMVGNLTVGKAKYADVQEDLKKRLTELESLRHRLVDLIERDAQAFAPLAAAYRMPKNTPEEQEQKSLAIQQALLGATEAPLDIMRVTMSAIDDIEFMASKGSRMAVSDAADAAIIAQAAIKGASLNVFINVAIMDDKDVATRLRQEAEDYCEQSQRRCDAIFDKVSEALRR